MEEANLMIETAYKALTDKKAWRSNRNRHSRCLYDC